MEWAEPWEDARQRAGSEEKWLVNLLPLVTWDWRRVYQLPPQSTPGRRTSACWSTWSVRWRLAAPLNRRELQRKRHRLTAERGTRSIGHAMTPARTRSSQEPKSGPAAEVSGSKCGGVGWWQGRLGTSCGPESRQCALTVTVPSR